MDIEFLDPLHDGSTVPFKFKSCRSIIPRYATQLVAGTKSQSQHDSNPLA